VDPLSQPRILLRQDLESDVTVQLGVGGPIHLAHTALAELGGDLVMGDSRADHLRNPCQILLHSLFYWVAGFEAMAIPIAEKRRPTAMV